MKHEISRKKEGSGTFVKMWIGVKHLLKHVRAVYLFALKEIFRLFRVERNHHLKFEQTSDLLIRLVK